MEISTILRAILMVTKKEFDYDWIVRKEWVHKKCNRKVTDILTQKKTESKCYLFWSEDAGDLLRQVLENIYNLC